MNGLDGIAENNGGSEDKNDESIEQEMDTDEVMRLARELKIPPIPSIEEYNKHKLTHTPYKAWCPICVQGQAQNPLHKRNTNEREFPSFHMDYMFMSPNVFDEQSNFPILVLKEKTTGGVWAIPVMRKGINGGDQVVERLVKIIADFGSPKAILKCDQEPAIKDLQKETRKEMNNYVNQVQTDARETGHMTGVNIIIENSPVGESQSNGVAENAVKEVQCAIRKLKCQLEENMTVKLEKNSPIWPWLVQYAAQTIHTFKEYKTDGKTSRERIRGNPTAPEVCNFGESVLYKPSKTNVIAKAEPKWYYGIWLGFIDETNEL